MKTRYDTRATGYRFHEGDKVWLWNPTRRNRLSPKLQSPWDDPYTVLNRLNHVVRIRKSLKTKHKVVHYDRRLLQCGLRARTPLYRIPLTHDHRRLRLQWANQHRDWRADWQHVVFSDESRFNLWYHDGRIRVRRYAGERHLPECIIERHSGRTPGVMVWGTIAYHRRSQLLRIVGNLNSNRYIREVLQPEAVPFLQSLPGAVFQQDNARPHTARIVKSFFAAQQVQLLPWPACSPDMSPIEHVWDVIGRRLARDPRPVASAGLLGGRVWKRVLKFLL
ncbi:Transposable element Tcb1 transposase, partial [Stegodyphus mimosarum]